MSIKRLATPNNSETISTAHTVDDSERTFPSLTGRPSEKREAVHPFISLVDIVNQYSVITLILHSAVVTYPWNQHTCHEYLDERRPACLPNW